MAEPPTANADHFVEDYLAYLLARASHLVSDGFHARLATLGVSAPIWRVLSTLSDHDSLSIGDLADIVLMKQPTLSKILDRMISEGLVTRTPAESDRRRIHVAITDAGRDAVAGLIVDARRHEAEALAGFTPDEIETMKSVLRSLIARLGKRP